VKLLGLKYVEKSTSDCLDGFLMNKESNVMTLQLPDTKTKRSPKTIVSDPK